MLAALLLLDCANTPPPRAVLMPRPGLARGPSMAERNRECVSCHADVAREWRGSPHQRADLNPAYRRALAREPLAMCRSCHAPEADPGGAAPAALSELGVGCVTCHLRGQAVLAAPRSGGQAERAPHALVRDARFGSPAACAACHEFPFPDAALRAEPELMQSTLSEHQKSRYAKLACASCHMPASGGRRHHGFARRSERALREALVVRVTRPSPTRLALELESSGVGHAFPTGDLFRRLEISVEAVGDDYASVARSVRYLTRHYRPIGKRGLPRRVVRDDRLAPRARVELELPPLAGDFPLAWRVAYQRVEHPAGAGEESAVVESEVTLAEGIVSVPQERP